MEDTMSDEVRDKVAEAIWTASGDEYSREWSHPQHPVFLRCADAAIAAHLEALGAGGYVVVKLPEHVGVNGADNRVWMHSPYIEQEFNGDVTIADRIGFDVDELSDIAAALLAAAAKAEESR